MSDAARSAARAGSADHGAGTGTGAGTGAGAGVGTGADAKPDVPFRIDTRRTLWYRGARIVFISAVGAWFRPVVTGRARVPLEGPAILAPVHRSFADFAFSAFVTRRKLFFMTKDDLWTSRPLGKLLLALGAFPVHREGTDREALRRAQEVLERGQLLVLFPEGTRGEGPTVGRLQEGAAFLAARTGAPIVPIGIGGSDTAMPKGQRIPKSVRIRVAVGEPISPPVPPESGRVPRSSIHATTQELRRAIQSVYDDARRDFERG